MNQLIITNNKLVEEKYDNTLFIEGDSLDVIYKAREYVHRNRKLVTHPLKASARMNFSPYCSIVIGEQLDQADLRQLEIIEWSIEKYQKYNNHRNMDYVHGNDYETLDLTLLDSSFKDI